MFNVQCGAFMASERFQQPILHKQTPGLPESRTKVRLGSHVSGGTGVRRYRTADIARGRGQDVVCYFTSAPVSPCHVVT